MEDEKIVDLFLNRNEDAVKYVASKYGRRIYQLSYSITDDKETSEECVNDVYLALWNLIPPNSPKSYFYAFVARITRHISIDRCREKTALKRNAFITEIGDEFLNDVCLNDNVESAIDSMELGRIISAFLYSKSKQKRIIFMRRYFYMNTISDIAAKMAISESKVKTTLFRMRKELRDYLEVEGYVL